MLAEAVQRLDRLEADPDTVFRTELRARGHDLEIDEWNLTHIQAPDPRRILDLVSYYRHQIFHDVENLPGTCDPWQEFQEDLNRPSRFPTMSHVMAAMIACDISDIQIREAGGLNPFRNLDGGPSIRPYAYPGRKGAHPQTPKGAGKGKSKFPPLLCRLWRRLTRPGCLAIPRLRNSS